MTADDPAHALTVKQDRNANRSTLDERELLFKHLAVITGFLDQSSADDAHRRVTNSSKSLGDHLVEVGAISDDERNAIEELVERHIVKHNDDPQKSLSVVLPTVSHVDDAVDKTLTLGDHPDSSSPFESFGDYKVIGEIDKGGMGIVFKARQKSLNRLVALKAIRSGTFADDVDVKRFHSEAEAAAKLDHPGIVPVYEVGEANGQHFFSMAFIEGRSLASRVKDDGPLDARQAASLMRAVSDAVQFAHENQVVHRDIKPHNILLDKNEHPRITDFGLAKLQGGNELTATGQVMGTPSYMAPEQARGSIDEVGPVSDVYSLGATLYFLLTGRPLFQAATTMETIRQVIDNEPVPLRQLNPSIPRDIETICLKCLRKDLTKRYSTAAELADDLSRWIENKPIVARPVGYTEKVWLWCKRRPAVASLAVAFVLFAVFGTAAALERQSTTHAAGLVETLIKADTAEVSRIVLKIDKYRKWVDPLLHQKYAEAEDGSTEKSHLAIALVQTDKTKIDYLRDRLLAVPYNQFPAVRDALIPYKTALIEGFWKDVHDNELTHQHRFQAACALASYDDKQSENWQNEQVAKFVAAQLVSVRPSELLPWTNALRPVKDHLVDPLSTMYRNPDAGEQVRSFAAETLADYLSDDTERLFDLLADANEKQFETIFDKLATYQEKAVAFGNTEIAKLLSEDASEEDKETLAMRQANIAIMLLRMNAPKKVWPLLKHNPDPRVRSYIIDWVSPRGGDAKTIIARYEQESDVTIKRALLLCLGEFELSDTDKKPLIETLLEVYRSDPDAGLHAAAEWLLRQWGQGEKLTLIDKELQQTENELVAAKDNKRQWYINTQGQTFVILDAGEFQMGSPEGEAGRKDHETSHRRRIGRRIAIATKEVTREQWQAFSNVTNVWPPDQDELKTFSRSNDSPMIAMVWYEATHYCNWLSQQEGIPEHQWCYETNKNDEYLPGMKAKEKFWELTGYRLPTEAEWEYACRAGTTSSRYYGVTDSLLPRYAWSQVRSENHTHPVAILKPNDFGLFDMQGNVLEWCNDAYASYPASKEVANDTPDVYSVEETGRQMLRGGAFFNLTSYVRSAARIYGQPGYRYNSYGFRPARTYPQLTSSPTTE